MLQVIEVKYLKNYLLWLRFNDGTEGTVDLSNCLDGPMFEPLKDLAFFRKVSLDPEIDTIIWPNGVDLAPEFLKDHTIIS